MILPSLSRQMPQYNFKIGYKCSVFTSVLFSYKVTIHNHAITLISFFPLRVVCYDFSPEVTRLEGIFLSCLF